MLGSKSANIGLQRLWSIRKARIWRAFLIDRKKFSETRNGWLGRKESNLDMAISKSDALAYPRGVTEPHYITIEQASRNTRISRTVPNPQSPELWREMIHSEKNGRTLPIRGPEFKSEIPASIGLKNQHPRAENRRLQRRWRSERDSNARYGFVTRAYHRLTETRRCLAINGQAFAEAIRIGTDKPF
jgi:hypothetical protein